jgi:hypothetical protein
LAAYSLSEVKFMKAKRKQRRGRPRGGANGERIRDYPVVLVRVPPRTRRIVVATARVMKKTMCQVITDMVFYYQYVYLANNRPDEHALIESLVSAAEGSATTKRAWH